MSAIFGVFHRDGQPAGDQELGPMQAAMLPLGTDGSRLWFDGPVGLGQNARRITPHDEFEDQPTVDALSRCVLVADARIDNRDELTEQLGLPAQQAAALPDSAFILRAYLRWGAECSKHLMGPCSFALYDPRESRLLLSRSPRGERPLLYAQQGAQFAFATGPGALFTLPFVTRQLSLERLAEFLVTLPPLPGATFYKGVTNLPAGHALTVERDDVRLNRFWQLDLDKPIRFPKDADYVEAFDELLGRVMEDHLRSAWPVGIMMSGGLDSASLGAVAAEKLRSRNQRLFAFTEVPRQESEAIVPRARYADESPYVDAIGAMYENIAIEKLSTDDSFYLRDIESFFRAAEIPFRNASNSVWIRQLAQRSASRGARVLLTGNYGNLTFSWDGQYMVPELLSAGRLIRAVSEARSAVRRGFATSAVRPLAGGALHLLPVSVRRAIHRARRSRGVRSRFWERYSPIAPDFAEQQQIEERARARNHDLDGLNFEHLRAGVLCRTDLASEMDRGYSALNGIELRHPAGDQRIVEFCVNLPEEQYRREGIPRWLIRRAMQGRLPREVLDNPRRGLQAAGWARSYARHHGEIAAELDAMARHPIASAVIDIPRLRRVSDAVVKECETRPADLSRRSVLDIGLMTGRFLRWLDA